MIAGRLVVGQVRGRRRCKQSCIKIQSHGQAVEEERKRVMTLVDPWQPDCQPRHSLTHASRPRLTYADPHPTRVNHRCESHGEKSKFLWTLLCRLLNHDQRMHLRCSNLLFAFEFWRRKTDPCTFSVCISQGNSQPLGRYAPQRATPFSAHN